MISYEEQLLLFTSDNRALADELGYPVRDVVAWRAGKRAVPRIVIAYLKLKKTAPDNRWKFDGDRLLLPFGGVLRYDELSRLPDYRRAFDVASRQADLIERLMSERDFYRANCHRQARFGAMLNGIFDDGQQKRNDSNNQN